jgi:hypothetical protein
MRLPFVLLDAGGAFLLLIPVTLILFFTPLKTNVTSPAAIIVLHLLCILLLAGWKIRQRKNLLPEGIR